MLTGLIRSQNRSATTPKAKKAQNKCNHETKKCPNKEPTTSNKKAKTKTNREKTKMTREEDTFKEIYSDKGKSRGQKEVEQMMGTREMSNEERKQSKKKNKQEMKGPDDTHRNLT